VKKHFSDSRRSNYIIDSNFNYIYEEFEDFKGYISLTRINEVEKALYVPRENRKDDCILDKNYVWLALYPTENDKNYTITAMFDNKLNIIEWYIDIVNSVGVEDNVPCMEDLYLDIVITNLGEIIVLDRDELEEAYNKKNITKEQYELAINEGNRIVEKYSDKDEIKRLYEFTKKCLNKVI